VLISEEAQINYILKLIKPLLSLNSSGSQYPRPRFKSLTIKPHPFEAYNAILQSRLRNTVWMGCNSFYREGDKGDGKNHGTFPGPVFLFWWWLRKVDWREWDVDGDEGLLDGKGIGKWAWLGLVTFISAALSVVGYFRG
jgi:hypothetical protein